MTLSPRPSSRSEVHDWMLRHWSVISSGRVNWRWMMREIEQAGLTDGNGRAPKLTTAQRTYRAIKLAVREGRIAAQAPLTSRPLEPLTPRSTSFGLAKVEK